MSSSTRLPWSQRFFFGVGHAFNDLVASMWFSYLIVYLQLVLGFDPTYAGFLLLVGQVADAIATPLLGYEITNTSEGKCCKRYGKRKIIHLIGTICVLVSFPFIFIVCPGCEDASEFGFTIMLIPLVVIFQIGWAAVQVSHLSLIPAITPYAAERDFLNVLRYAVDIMSDTSTYVIVWVVFDLTRKPTGDHHAITGEYANKFMLIAVIIVSVGLVFSAIFHLGLKESQDFTTSPEENQKITSSLEDKSFSSETVSWKGWLREIHFYQVGLIYTFVRLYHNMGLVFMPLYLQESLEANDDFIAKIPLVMNLSGFAVSLAVPKFFKVFSKKLTFFGGVLIAIGSSVWIAFGHGGSFCSWGIYCVGLTMGAAASILVISSLSFIHDLIGTSAESGAFVYGCMSFYDKLANGVAGMAVQRMHAVTCDNCNWFYKCIMSYGIGSTAVIASIFVLFLVPTNLGQRRSAYNGAAKSPYGKLVTYESTEDSDETKPLLKS